MISMIDFKKNIYLKDRINIWLFPYFTVRVTLSPSSERWQTYWNGLSCCLWRRPDSHWSDHSQYFSASSGWTWAGRRPGGLRGRRCPASALLSWTFWPWHYWRPHWGLGTSWRSRRYLGRSLRCSAVSGRGSCSGLSSGAPGPPGSGLGSGSAPGPVVEPGGELGGAKLTGTGPAGSSLLGICNSKQSGNWIFGKTEIFLLKYLC